MAFWKSPARVQQMQPELSSVTVMPASFIKAPSTPISPYSFSRRITFSFFRLPISSLRIRVVFPAPRKPEMRLTFAISVAPFLLDMDIHIRRDYNTVFMGKQEISGRKSYYNMCHFPCHFQGVCARKDGLHKTEK